MDLEETFERVIDNFLQENKQSDDELIMVLKKDPVLRKLAQAVSEEFDENGNYIGK